MSTTPVAEVIDAYVDAQGVAVTSVKDGHVFVFSAKTLEALLRGAQKTGRIVLFVKHQVPA